MPPKQTTIEAYCERGNRELGERVTFADLIALEKEAARESAKPAKSAKSAKSK